jgi:hypothetical protein
MKRLLFVLAILLLAAPASAGAKGLVSLAVCGTDGCHTTRDRGRLEPLMNAIPQADPGRLGAFYKLRLGIGEPGQRGTLGHVESQWIPSLGLIRGQDGPLAGYTLPQPASARLLRRMSAGLHAFPAAKLHRVGDPNDAQVSEVVAAPPSSGSGGGDGGDGTGWEWALLAIVPAGLAVWMLRRRRGTPGVSGV